MHYFKYFYALLPSFGSADFYRRVVLRWKGGALLYLFFLITLCWVITGTHFYLRLNEFVQQHLSLARQVVTQLPDLEIKAGKASIHESLPYIIHNPQNLKPLIIFETNKTAKEITQTQAPVIIAEDAFMMRAQAEKLGQPAKTHFTYIFPPQMNLIFNTAPLQQNSLFDANTMVVMSYYSLFSPSLIKNTALLFTLTGIFFSFAGHALFALIWAGLGLLFLNFTHKKLRYAGIYRLAIVSLTPPLLIKTFLNLFHLHFFILLLLGWLLHFAYFSFALLSCQEKVVASDQSVM